MPNPYWKVLQTAISKASPWVAWSRDHSFTRLSLEPVAKQELSALQLTVHIMRACAFATLTTSLKGVVVSAAGKEQSACLIHNYISTAVTPDDLVLCKYEVSLLDLPWSVRCLPDSRAIIHLVSMVEHTFSALPDGQAAIPGNGHQIAAIGAEG